MFIRDLIQFEFHKPELETPITGSLTASSIEDALNADDAEPEVKPEAKDDDEEVIPDRDFKLGDDTGDNEDVDDSDEKDEESDDKEEKDEEEKELNLDDEDEIELARIPKRQEIKAAYPDIFKKFPALDHIIQREHAFAEVFPTVSDAKEAKGQVENFNQFQSELLNGDIAGVLKSVKDVNPKAFAKITDEMLDSLVKVDPNSHLGITARVSKGILNHIHTAATVNLKKNPNDKQAQQLQIASELIYEAIFPEVTPFSAQQQQREEENPEIAKFKTEKQEFERSRFQAAFNTVASSVNRTLKSAVEREIDTKNLLTPYVKTRVVDDVMSELDKQLGSDTRFRLMIDRLWQKAKENNFSDQSLDHIKNALKEKAKTILTPIMRAKKGEAIKGLSVSRNNDDKRELSRNARENRTSQNKLTRSRSESDRLVPRQGESAVDFLMRD